MLKKILIPIFFIFIGLVYLHNLTRDIYGGDIGDLVTAAYVFGVAHPPGYPLFSLIGFIFSHLPIPLPVVSRVGLISVFSSLAALVIYYRFCFKISKSVFISLLSTAILAFSYLFWLTAEIPEGLALNNLFTVVILYSAINFYKEKNPQQLYLLFLFIGFSLTHQFYIITIFPAVLFLIIKHYRVILTKNRLFLICLFLILGLSFYLYLPIAASKNPVINWDKPVNLKNFLHLVLRKDYGGIKYLTQNVPFSVRMVNVNHYLKTIADNFSYQILLIAFFGLIKLIRTNGWLAIGLTLAWLFSGAITIFFTATPIYYSVVWGVIERYYGVSAIVLMFFVPYGFFLLKKLITIQFKNSVLVHLFLSYFLIIPFLLIKYNFPKTDLSKTNIGNNLARNILRPLPKNAVLFLSGDNVTFSVWYVYYVLKERQDIKIINQPGVGNNIYLNEALNQFYLNRPKTVLNNIFLETIREIKKTRRVFMTTKINPLPKEMKLLPRGLVMELVEKKDIPSFEKYKHETEFLWKNIISHRRQTLTRAEDNFIASEIPAIYARGLVQTANFLINQYQDWPSAEKIYRQAVWVDNMYSLAYSGLAISLFYGRKNCQEAVHNIKTAIYLYPLWKPYYRQLYQYAKGCSFSKKELIKIKQIYRQRFAEEIK